VEIKIRNLLDLIKNKLLQIKTVEFKVTCVKFIFLTSNDLFNSLKELENKKIDPPYKT
jgi:hypothetical protein